MPSYRQEMASFPRSSAASSAPPTSAAVLDFICLFTHDLKRKQKRWQDGKLKYHTFNKRVMVYDDRGNFVGDAHWSGDGDLEDGEELELDRGGAIVQVAECTGSREQDLTELLDKRAREVEKRRQIAAAQQPRRTPVLSRVPDPMHSSLGQRPLSTAASAATPARIGRAHIPQHSPFEARMAQAGEQRDDDTPPPSKRRKRSESPPSKTGHAKALFGTTLTLSARPTSSLSKILRDRTNVGSLLQTRPKAVKPTAPESDDDVEEEEEAMADAQPVRPTKRKPSVEENLPPPADLSRPLPKPRLQVTKVSEPRRPKIPEPPRAKSPERELQTVVLEGEETSEDAGPPVQVVRPEKRKKNSTTGPKKAKDVGEAPISKSEKIPTKAPVKTKSKPEKSRSEKLEPEKPRLEKSEPQKPRPEEKECSSVTTSDAPEKAKDEPRTELRIRSRKRRGLLMLSEKSLQEKVPAVLDLAPEVHTSNIPDEASGFLDTQTGNQSASKDVKKSPSVDMTDTPPVCAPTHTPVIGEEATVEDKAPLSRDTKRGRKPMPMETERHASKSPSPPPRRRQRQQEKKNVPTMEEADKTDRTDSESDVPARKRSKPLVTQKTKSLASERTVPGIEDDSESEDDWEGPRPSTTKQNAKTKAAPKAQPKDQATESGPRISRLGRKSVKSKEIFGFKAPESDHLVPHAFASALGRIGATAITPACASVPAPAPAFVPVTRVEPKESMAQATKDKETEKQDIVVPPTIIVDESKSHSDAVSESGPRRIANPASRGRKAATKADAAGQPPRVLVPFDTTPALAMPPRAPRAPVQQHHHHQQQQEAQHIQQTVVASKTSLPAFAKANGGAWSRHAYDLLGMSRPGGKGSN